MKLENDAIFTLLQMGRIRASTVKAENTRKLLPPQNQLFLDMHKLLFTLYCHEPYVTPQPQSSFFTVSTVGSQDHDAN